MCPGSCVPAARNEPGANFFPSACTQVESGKEKSSVGPIFCNCACTASDTRCEALGVLGLDRPAWSCEDLRMWCLRLFSLGDPGVRTSDAKDVGGGFLQSSSKLTRILSPEAILPEPVDSDRWAAAGFSSGVVFMRSRPTRPRPTSETALLVITLPWPPGNRRLKIRGGGRVGRCLGEPGVKIGLRGEEARSST